MNDTEMIIDSPSPEATAAVAQALGQAIPAGTVLAAYGELGAGKTLFAAHLALGLGVSEPVTSPTFVYFRDYQGRLPFCHIDAYRLENLEQQEKELIGLDDCFRRDKIVLAEWPQFIKPWLPPETISLFISRTGDASRELRFCLPEAAGDWLIPILREAGAR